nr:MAG TPA: hypothetical protein [Caudoviricetes sp.]
MQKAAGFFFYCFLLSFMFCLCLYIRLTVMLYILQEGLLRVIRSCMGNVLLEFLG